MISEQSPKSVRFGLGVPLSKSQRNCFIAVQFRMKADLQDLAGKADALICFVFICSVVWGK